MTLFLTPITAEEGGKMKLDASNIKYISHKKNSHKNKTNKKRIIFFNEEFIEAYNQYNLELLDNILKDKEKKIKRKSKENYLC